MAEHEAIKLFESLRVRIIWDDVEEKYYFSVVDVVSVLTESADGRKYWNKLKQRLVEEGNQTVTNCHQLKLTAADGKKRLTDVADSEQILRIIQSIPSKKAEPFKQWLAQVGASVSVRLIISRLMTSCHLRKRKKKTVTIKNRLL